MPVALSTNALTTVSAVRDELGLSSSAGEDPKLTRWINAVSDAVERYCQRSFYRVVAQVEAVAGFGTLTLRVTRRPVNTLTGITYNGTSVDLTDVTVHDANAGLIERIGGWLWTAHQASDMSTTSLPGTERKLYSVTYDGGWYTPKQVEADTSLTRSLPWDLEQVAIDLVRWMRASKGQRDRGIKSEKLESWAATYTSDPEGWPADIRSVLDRYRAPVMA